MSKKYKYVVNSITFREELKKIMNYGIHIVGIVLEDYNDEIDELPQSLKSLTINGNNFNQSFDKLPQSLKLLNIWGDNFNQSLDQLPQSLKILTINGSILINKLPYFLI